MKKYLKYSGIIAALFAVVAFILMMATPGMKYVSGNSVYNYPGTLVIFGGTQEGLLLNIEYKLAATALIAWILILAAVVILLLGVILPLLKVNALQKFAGVLNLVAVIALVVGGILLFFSKAAFISVNEMSTDNAHLGGGWVAAGILAIFAGCFAILPAAFDFIGKKK